MSVVMLQSSVLPLRFLVKPLPPSNVKAEITRNDGLLNVSWANPVFANDDLKFQIRYAVNEEELTWEVLSLSIRSKARTAAVLSCRLSAGRCWWSWLWAVNHSSEYLHYLARECYWVGLSPVGFIFKSFDCHTCWNNPLFLLSVFWLLLQLYEVLSVSTRSAVIEVQLCVEYIVQIRCRALDGLGYWSNWSRSAYAAVKDIQGRCACRLCSGGVSSFRLRCDTVLSKL